MPAANIVHVGAQSSEYSAEPMAVADPSHRPVLASNTRSSFCPEPPAAILRPSGEYFAA